MSKINAHAQGSITIEAKLNVLDRVIRLIEVTNPNGIAPKEMSVVFNEAYDLISNGMNGL